MAKTGRPRLYKGPAYKERKALGMTLVTVWVSAEVLAEIDARVGGKYHGAWASSKGSHGRTGYLRQLIHLDLGIPLPPKPEPNPYFREVDVRHVELEQLDELGQALVTMYRAGHATTDIYKWLREHGVKPPAGRRWSWPLVHDILVDISRSEAIRQAAAMGKPTPKRVRTYIAKAQGKGKV
jgi:hypothetical protein